MSTSYFFNLSRFLRAMSLSIRWQKGSRRIRGGRRVGLRQRSGRFDYHAVQPFIELDFINCLIHARIVCDRTIALARQFIVDQRVPSFNSFHDHKRFFERLQQPYGPHEEYARYFRDETSWFDMPLKPVRDQYFVHQGPQHMRFLGYQSDHDLQMVIVLPNGPVERRFERTQIITVSVRRLARDLHAFLVWFNAYGIQVSMNANIACGGRRQAPSRAAAAKAGRYPR